MAARIGRSVVNMVDFENAKDKVMMGAERRSMVLTADQKEKPPIMKRGMRLLVLAFHNVIRYIKPQLSRVAVPWAWSCLCLKLTV